MNVIIKTRIYIWDDARAGQKNRATPTASEEDLATGGASSEVVPPSVESGSSGDGAAAGAGAIAEHEHRVHIFGTGKAVTKAVSVAEIIKQKVPGLKQDTSVSHVQMEDIFVPKEGTLCPCLDASWQIVCMYCY